MRKLILCCALIVYSSFAFSQKRLIHEKWDKIDVIKDIELSTIKDFVNEKGLMPYRVKFITNQDMLEVISLMGNVNNITNWVQGLEKNEALLETPTRHVVYRVLKRVIPFKKRDFVIESLNFLDFADRKMSVLSKSVDVPVVAESFLMQRGLVLDAFFTVRANSKSETEVQFGTLTDLAGWAPVSLSNKLVREQLIEFAASLKKELETKEIKISPLLESFRSKLYR